MNVWRSKNVISIEHNALREVDDFDISRKASKRGEVTLLFSLGEFDSLTCNLKAASDDFRKLKEWMEAIARDEQLTSVSLGDGSKITCELTDILESTVEKTYRYLDELFPSPIAVISVTTESGETYSAVLKVKHFINALYVTLMMFSVRGEEAPTKQWYPYTEEYKKEEDYKTWMKNSPHWHQSQVSSSLIEWYLESSERYTSAKPQFQNVSSIGYIVNMWADYGCIFWRDGISIGEITTLDINDLDFDFSDVEGLEEWYADFPRLSEEFQSINEETEKETQASILQEIEEWHIRGFKLAQKIRKRLPINVILHYEQSWDVGFGLPYFKKDKGRIIFESRKIDKNPNRYSWWSEYIDNLNSVVPEELSGNSSSITGG